MIKVINFYSRIFAVVAFLFSPFICLLIFLRKRPRGENVKILVVPQLTRVGDIICSTPVFKSIKENYPNSFLSVLVSEKAAGILKNNPRIDELIIIENYKKNFTGLLKKIIITRFDFGISLSGTPLSSLLFFLGLISHRVKLIREENSFFEKLTNWMNNEKYFYKNHNFLPGFYLKMLNSLGLENQLVVKEVFFGENSQKLADDFALKNGLSDKDLIIGMGITTGNKIKEWGDNKFSELARGLVKEFGARIVFVGAEGDGARVAQLVLGLGGGMSYIQATNFSLEDVPALFKKFSLFVAGDTGPIYIAHSLKIPLVDITGPVDPNEQIPNDERSIQVRPPAEILPSVFAFKKEGPFELQKKSLETISIENVMGAIKRLLKRNNNF